MPNYLKPITKVAPEQMKAILERIVARRSAPKLTAKGGMDPQMARMMADQDPVREKVYGQLLAKNQDAPELSQRMTLPIEEAMNKYMADPDKYSRIPVGPPAKHVYPTAPHGPEDATAMGRGIAMERMKFQDPVPPEISRNVQSMRRELTGANDPMLQQKQAMEKLMNPGMANTMKKTQEIGNIGDVLGMAARLEDLWKALGGGRGGIAGVWKQYLQGSNQKGKVMNAKDYFIASAIRNHNDPAMMAKMYPREKKLLDNMKQIYKDQVGVDLDTGLPITKKPELPELGDDLLEGEF